MKRISIILALFAATTAWAQPQGGFGFGGQQLSAEQMHYSQKFSDINYAGDDKAYHTLDIYLPEKRENEGTGERGNEKYPVVVHIYGSAWFSNSSKGMADLGTICAALLKAGYAVVTPNHRSSQDAKYPAQIHDIKAVIRYLRANADKYQLDTTFVATSGFSSGGHLSSLAAAASGTKQTAVGTEQIDLEGSVGAYTDYSSRVNVAADWSGPVDLLHMDCGKAMMMNPSPEQVLLGGVTKEDAPDKYRSLSVATYLDKNDPPIIVFHGTEDNVVPFCQGEQFSVALQDAGVKSEFYPVDGGGHGFNMYTEENLARMVKFFDAARNK